MNFLKEYQKWGEPATRFIFDQAESRLKQVIEAGRILTDRAYNILGICIAFLVAIIGYGSVRYEKISNCESLNTIDILAITTTFFLLFNLGILLYVIFPKKVYPMGRVSADFFNYEKIFIKDNISPEDIAGAILMAEIKDYQMRMDKNTNNNVRRTFLLKTVLYILSACLIANIIIILFL